MGLLDSLGAVAPLAVAIGQGATGGQIKGQQARIQLDQQKQMQEFRTAQLQAMRDYHDALARGKASEAQATADKAIRGGLFKYAHDLNGILTNPHGEDMRAGLAAQGIDPADLLREANDANAAAIGANPGGFTPRFGRAFAIASHGGDSGLGDLNGNHTGSIPGVTGHSDTSPAPGAPPAPPGDLAAFDSGSLYGPPEMGTMPAPPLPPGVAGPPAPAGSLSTPHGTIVPAPLQGSPTRIPLASAAGPQPDEIPPFSGMNATKGATPDVYGPATGNQVGMTALPPIPPTITPSRAAGAPSTPSLTDRYSRSPLQLSQVGKNDAGARLSGVRATDIINQEPSRIGLRGAQTDLAKAQAGATTTNAQTRQAVAQEMHDHNVTMEQIGQKKNDLASGRLELDKLNGQALRALDAAHVDYFKQAATTLGDKVSPIVAIQVKALAEKVYTTDPMTGKAKFNPQAKTDLDTYLNSVGEGLDDAGGTTGAPPAPPAAPTQPSPFKTPQDAQAALKLWKASPLEIQRIQQYDQAGQFDTAQAQMPPSTLKRNTAIRDALRRLRTK